MAVASPWSQMVVEYLARVGLSIHVVDTNNSSLDAHHRVQTERIIASLRQQMAGVHILPLPSFLPARLLAGARAVRRLARTHDAQMVLTLYGGMQATLAWLSGTRPYAVYVVGSDVLLANWGRNLLTRAALRGAAAVLANGRHLAERTALVAPEVEVRTLYLGIDIARFRPPTRRPAGPQFVCTRAFNPVYSNETIVRAVAAVPRLVPEFRLRFLSTGPLIESTVALANRLLPDPARAQVSFDRGVSDSVLVDALRSASFYLSASRSDGASASLLEAMACGVLPIVSDIPANREWITDGVNGLLFPVGDASTLARCLQAAMDGLPWMDNAIRHNLALVAERGSVEVNMRRLADLLRHGGLDCTPTEAH